MRLPRQAPAIQRDIATSPYNGGVDASGCSIFKKAACLAAAATCGTACIVTGGAACLSCVSGIVSGCGDCL